MTTNQTITEHDEGKRVVDADGETVGVIASVKNSTAYVDPDPGIADTIMSKLGWNSVEDEDYPLRRSRIEAITEDEVRLKREL